MLGILVLLGHVINPIPSGQILFFLFLFRSSFVTILWVPLKIFLKFRIPKFRVLTDRTLLCISLHYIQGNTGIIQGYFLTGISNLHITLVDMQVLKVCLQSMHLMSTTGTVPNVTLKVTSKY